MDYIPIQNHVGVVIGYGWTCGICGHSESYVNAKEDFQYCLQCNSTTQMNPKGNDQRD